MSQPVRRGASLDDFWAIPEHERFHELVGGELTQKAAPSGEHGDAQAGIVAAVRPPFQRQRGGGGLGGWWILTEVELWLETADIVQPNIVQPNIVQPNIVQPNIVRPDVVGWRREHCPERPTGTPIRIRPDWICEVVSPSNATDDTVKKLRLYHRIALPHYWVVDPRDATLTVMRWSADGYVTLLRAERAEVVRAEPFQAIELAVGTLFGDDPG